MGHCGLHPHWVLSWSVLDWNNVWSPLSGWPKHSESCLTEPSLASHRVPLPWGLAVNPSRQLKQPVLSLLLEGCYASTLALESQPACSAAFPVAWELQDPFRVALSTGKHGGTVLSPCPLNIPDYLFSPTLDTCVWEGQPLNLFTFSGLSIISPHPQSPSPYTLLTAKTSSIWTLVSPHLYFALSLAKGSLCPIPPHHFFLPSLFWKVLTFPFPSVIKHHSWQGLHLKNGLLWGEMPQEVFQWY